MRRCLALVSSILTVLPLVSAAQQHPGPAVPALDPLATQLPYAVDHVHGQPQLVPVHPSPVKQHSIALPSTPLATGQFVQRGPVGELAGAHAQTVLHDATPAFYVHSAQSARSGETRTFALVQTFPGKDRRVFAQIQNAPAPGHPRHIVGLIALTTQTLPDGWLKITPAAPLDPGEYALNPVPATQDSLSTVVFDFRIDPEHNPDH